MVVGDLDVVSVAGFPAETNSVLVVYADAEMAGPIAPQPLQSIRRRRREVTKLVRAVDLSQAAEGYAGNLLESPDAALMIDRFRVAVVKRTNQTIIILRFALYEVREARGGCRMDGLEARSGIQPSTKRTAD